MRRQTASALAIATTALLVPALVPGAATAAAPAATGTSTLYLVQGVDATTMTLSLDGRVVGRASPAKTVLGPLTVRAGKHTLTALPASGGPVSAEVTLAAGASTDAVLHRQADVDAPPVFTAYRNDLSAVTASSGRLTVAHVAAVGPADIRVKGKVLFANVANGEQLTLTVPAATYPVDIVPTATSGPVVFGPADVPVAAGRLTRVFAIGVAATNSMDAVVQVLPVATRGSGSVVSSVEAGDGGQAQALIARHARAAGDRGARGAPLPTTAWLVLPVLLAGAAGLALLRRRRTT